jgi:CBS domain-containing protein
MKASEVMATNVVTVEPRTAVKDIAEIMTGRRISGVPVVDGGKLVGIVSETDLLHRAETGTEKRHKWWLGAFMDADRMAREYAASHGRVAADIMTRNVVTVKADAELGDVADLLDRRKLKRVPVVDGGALVGMITRGDLVRAFLAKAKASEVAQQVDDATLTTAIKSRMRRESWLDASLVNLDVKDGVVVLEGLVSSQDQLKALSLLVAETPGVVRVDTRLRLRPRDVTV